MSQQASSMLIFVIEDWHPVAPDLGRRLEQLGFRIEVLPNILELVRKRVRRDHPEMMVVNANSLVIGEAAQWRQLLGGETTSLVVVPQTATASFFDGARALGFAGMCGLPLSREKLMLALDLAYQNRRAARRLRQETRRLQALQERLQGGRGTPRNGTSSTAVRETPGELVQAGTA